MSAAKYKVGDWVRIRQCDDMEAEYGLDEYGNIEIPLTFVDAMREFCGHWGRIKEVCEGHYNIRFSFAANDWSWSDEMLEPEQIYQPGDIVVLRSWADMEHDFNMYTENKMDNPTYLVGNFSQWFIGQPITVRSVEKTGNKYAILFEEVPCFPHSFRYMEFTPYCIDHVTNTPIITPSISFDDLFSIAP